MPKLFSVVIICLLLSGAFSSAVAEIPGNEINPELKVITVATVNELVEAIDSNRIIQLSPGIYNLSLADYPETSNFSGEQRQLIIFDVKNLSIIGMGDQLAGIQIEDPSAYVMVFKNCRNVTLKNLEIGHQVEQSNCAGGVLAFENCSDIVIENSILAGSATEGLTLTKVASFKFSNSTIKDCSSGILTCLDSTNLEFTESYFLNNQGFNFLNFFNCANILLGNCEISNNTATPGETVHLYTGHGLFNICKTSDLKLKNSHVFNNSAEYLLCADDKEAFKNENSFFGENSFTGGCLFPIEGFSVNSFTIPTIGDGLREFYKKLEYLSRKLNDPDKMDKPKSRKLYESYWGKAVNELEELIELQGTDWEKESLLGRFYQLGLQLDEKKVWEKAETHLKKAISLKPDLPNVNHLALGVLYGWKIFTFKAGETDNNSKLTVKLESNHPPLTTAAEKEFLLDSRFPGTANIYLFLLYYFQGEFIEAVKQAEKYLAAYPGDELVKKLRGMAKARIGNKKAPGELNVYIQREKLRQLFDFYFYQGSGTGNSQEVNLNNEGRNNPYRQRLAEIILDGLEFNLGNTREEIIRNLGKPLKLKTRQVENRHQEGIIDTIYELTFDGLYVSIYDAQGKEIIFSQKISSPKYKVKYGLNVGVIKEYVKEQLGEPVEENAGQFKYVYDNEIGSEIFLWFVFKDNWVAEIEWSFTID